MLQKLIWVYLFSLGFSCLAQEEPKETIYEVLSENERGEWYNTRKTWEDKYFSNFLKKYRIKLNCATCISIYVDLTIQVMEDGHSHIKVTQTKKCGSGFNTKQVEELEKLLFNMQFAPVLYNKKFKVRIGNGLKC